MSSKACHIVGDILLAANVQLSMISKTSLYRSADQLEYGQFPVTWVKSRTVELVLQRNGDDRHENSLEM
jgi:hypothetical protein